MKPPQGCADKAAPCGWMQRLVRCSLFCWWRSVGVIWAAKHSQNLFGKIISRLAIWVCVTVAVAGGRLMANQSITQLEELAATPWKTETIVAPDGIHQVEIHWLDNGEGLRVRMVKIPADHKEKSAESLGGTLALVPPRDEPCGPEADGKATGGTISGNPVHHSKWVTALSITAGQIAGVLIGGLVCGILTGSVNLRWLRK